MSFEAVAWAMRAPLECSSTKFVLLVMANWASYDKSCWLSVEYLAEATVLDGKTVDKSIKDLIGMGFIADMGTRKGPSGRVRGFMLGKKPAFLPKTPSSKQAAASLPVPSESPPAIPKKAVDEVALFAGEGVPLQVILDFLAVRRGKKMLLTQTALDGLKRDAIRAGLSLEDAIRVCCTQGWGGFKLDYYLNLYGYGGSTSNQKFDALGFMFSHNSRLRPNPDQPLNGWLAPVPELGGRSLLDYVFVRMDGAYTGRWSALFKSPGAVYNWRDKWGLALDKDQVAASLERADRAVDAVTKAYPDWPCSAAQFVQACKAVRVSDGVAALPHKMSEEDRAKQRESAAKVREFMEQLQKGKSDSRG